MTRVHKPQASAHKKRGRERALVKSDQARENYPYYVLLNPGPVNTSSAVQKALTRGDLCHREKEFSDLLIQTRRNLLRAFGIEKDFTAIFLTGSGTAALEAALVSCLNPRRRVLVLSNGVYGDRMDHIVSLYGFPKLVLRVQPGDPLPIPEIRKLLSSDLQIDAVAMVHHETSTGMLNPVNEIASLKEMKGRRMILDSISALGAEELSFKNESMRVCVCTANKCIEGLPGISFVLLQKKELEYIQAFPQKSLYFDLRNYWKEQKHGGVPFTPAVQIFYALDRAVKELIQEKVSKRIRRYASYARQLREGFSKLGLEYFILPQYHSNTLTALRLPDRLSYERLHDELKKKGFVIYAGQGRLSREIFRVANMGRLNGKIIERFLEALENILKKYRI